MSFEVVTPALKDSLDRSVENGELREILYRQGIQRDEPVLLSIKINDIDKVINYNIPTTVAQTQKSFNEEIKKFLNDAEEYKLLTNLYPSSDDLDPTVSDELDPTVSDDWEAKCSYIFDIPSQNKTLLFESGICKKPFPPHVCP